MDPVTLARFQFAFTVAFHYIFPPITIGLGVVLVLLEARSLRTGDAVSRAAARFWVKVFSLVFAMGVATGIVMEFQFGTNWASYSRFVGDVFGSPLAAEAVLAFFLESGFLAVLVFGWDRVSPRVHLLSSVMVALGAHLSAVWILIANSWQQTPAGFHLVGQGAFLRAEIVDFRAMVFNPSMLYRLSHTICGAWQTGACFVVSISAWYLLRRRHVAFAKASLAAALPVALAACLIQMETGHRSALAVAVYQPAKLAAMEGHYEASGPAALQLFGWVDEERERVIGVGVPGMLSLLVTGDRAKPVTGLRAFAPADRPPVNIVFQAHHAMVGIGTAMIGLLSLAALLWWRGRLFDNPWALRLLLPAVLGPLLANQLGWVTAEVGRQPWIVYGLLRTSQGISAVVPAWQILASLTMFVVVYAGLGLLFVYLLAGKIAEGPQEAVRT